jgi:uncharacterized protein YaiL (DUF2058 family)
MTATPPDQRIDELENELDRARDEIESLRTSHTRRHVISRKTTRTISSGVFIFVVSLLVAATTTTVWLDGTLLDTDEYVKTVTPLAHNSDVQAAVADRVTTELFTKADAAARVQQELSPTASALAAPITAQLHEFVEQALLTFMDTDAFMNVWKDANRVTHTQIQSLLLNDQKTAVVNDNGTVFIDLHALVDRLLDQLQASGITLFQNVDTSNIGGRVELFHSNELERASFAARTLHTARYAFPFFLVLFVAAAVALAPRKRPAIGWLGVALFAGMLMVLSSTIAARHVAITEAADLGFDHAAAGATFDTTTRYLHRVAMNGLVLGALIVAAVTLSGSGRLAQTVRASIRTASLRIANWLHAQGWSIGAQSTWVADHIAIVRSLVIVFAATVLLTWPNPTFLVLGLDVGLTLLGLFLIEVMRAGSAQQHVHAP